MKTLRQNIKEISKLAANMPKTINEALNYEGQMEPQEDVPMNAEELPSETGPAFEPGNEGEDIEKNEGDSLNVEEFVDDIRKKSLRGMAQLAENPDDERYQLLKKIWQICDKKPEQQTAFNNPNQQMQQAQRKF